VTPHLAPDLVAPPIHDGDTTTSPARAARRSIGLRGMPPWTPADQMVLVVSTALGAAGLLWCWRLSAGDISWGQRLQWLTLAVVALIVAGVGDGLWLLQGHRAVRRQKQVLLRLIDASAGGTPHGLDAGSVTLDTDRWAGERMTRYHRAGCLLVAGKPVTCAPADEHVRAGRAPCAICGA
jgi:hypothetical protein